MSRKNPDKKTWLRRFVLFVLRQCKSPEQFLAWIGAFEGLFFGVLGCVFLICMLLPFLYYAKYGNPKVLLISAISLLLFLLTRLDRKFFGDTNNLPAAQAQVAPSSNPVKWLRIAIPVILIAVSPYARGNIGRVIAELIAALKIEVKQSLYPPVVQEGQSAPAPAVQRPFPRGQVLVPAPEPAEERSPLESDLLKREKFLEEHAKLMPPSSKDEANSDEYLRQNKPKANLPAKPKLPKAKAQQTN